MLILLLKQFLLQIGVAEETAVLGEIECENIQKFAEQWDFDFMDWVRNGISGDYDLLNWLKALFSGAEQFFLSDLKLYGVSLLAPGTIMIVSKLIVPGTNGGRFAANFACRVCCISTLIACFVQMRTAAMDLLDSILKCSETMVPVMISAMTLSGADSGAALVSPAAGLLANIIQNVMQKWGLAMASAAAIVAVSGNLGVKIRLKKLFDLLKRVLHWGTGILVGMFTTMLTLQGKLGAGRDTAAVRTARYAVENLLPVVGGNLSDSLDSLLAAAVNVQNILGMSGLMLLISICAVPLARLLGEIIILKLCSAILEPAGDDLLTAMISQFGDSLEMLAIIVLAATLLCGLLLSSSVNSIQAIIR